MNELKPCPFCGGIAELEHKFFVHSWDSDDIGRTIYFARCITCGAQSKAMTNEEKVPLFWNRRVVE